MIQASQLQKTYPGGDRAVLAGIDLELSSGEFVAVMGPSGSGKSTLLLALSGTDSVSAGAITFEGRDLSTLSEDELADLRRNRMGFVFQSPTLLKNLNVLDNILLPLVNRKHLNTKTATEKALRLMERTGIAGLQDREINEVSGGQLQRVGICRALINDPAVLFADEPTGALNSQTATEIMELFRALHREGATLFIVTHDAKVSAYAKRVLFMKDGKIIEELRFNEDESLETRTEIVRAHMNQHGI